MKTFILILAYGFIFSSAFAQFTVEAGFETMLDNNIDNNYLQIADKITSASFKTGFNWNTEQTNAGLFYSGAFNYYTQVIERTHHNHQMNFEYEKTFGEDDASIFNLNAGALIRLDRGDYTIYDHQIYNSSLRLKHFFTETIKSEGAYAFNYVRFDELPEFNYTEHSFTIEGAKYFDTKTTLIARANIGMKIYSTANYDSTVANSGMGRGQRQSSQSSPSVTQVISMLRIGQSLLENTGISLTAQYQFNIQKESRYLISEYGNLSDDAIFDDHYGFEGLLLSAMITQVLPFDARIRLISSVQNKVYSNLAAYDLSDNIIVNQRTDTRTSFTINFSKEFDTLGISLNASYDYIINASNDKFYDYTNNAFTVGISVPF